jgi:hypothetical protein
LIFPLSSALVGVVVVAGAAGAAGVVAAAHLQLQRRRQVHRLALKISCKNIKKNLRAQKKLKTYLGVVVVVVVAVGSFGVDLIRLLLVGDGGLRGGGGGCRGCGGRGGGGFGGLSLFNGAQVELLALEFKGDVFNLPNGGTLGHCEQRQANKSSGEIHSWSCSDAQLMLLQS